MWSAERGRSKAARFESSCFMVRAPMIVEVTPGRLLTHASQPAGSLFRAPVFPPWALLLHNRSDYAHPPDGLYRSTHPQCNYNSGMKRTAQARTRIAAWVLCVMLAWLSVRSPHCDLCDGPHATVLSSSMHPALTHPAPAEPDTCNGVCSCCGFHWLPDTRSLLTSVQTVSAMPPVEVALPPLTPRQSPYRPPRTAVS
jgi:hypothetical protein